MKAVEEENIDCVKELLSQIPNDKQLADFLNQKSGRREQTLYFITT